MMTIELILNRLEGDGGFRWVAANQQKISAGKPVQAVKLEIARFTPASQDHRAELQLFSKRPFSKKDPPSSIALSLGKGQLGNSTTDEASKAVFGMPFTELAEQFSACDPEVGEYQITCRDESKYEDFVNIIKTLVRAA